MHLNFKKPSNFHYNYVPDNLQGLRIQNSVCGFSNLKGLDVSAPESPT